MALLSQVNFLQALGWALFHSLWQMGICWLMYIIVTGNDRKMGARQRYNLAFFLVGLGSIFFLATLIYLTIAGADGGLFKLWKLAVSIESTYQSIFGYMNSAVPILSVAYLLGLVILLTRFYRQYAQTTVLFKVGVRKAEPSLRVFMENTRVVLGIKRKVKLGISDLVNTPLTIGFWKPIILLPVAAINNLSIEQTEAVILHELNHIKQNDYLINLLIAGLDLVMFFNPFSKWLTRALVREREHHCDDVVLQFKYSPRLYAEALYKLEKCRLVPVPLLAVPAVGSNEKILLQRIQRMLGGNSAPRPLNFKLILFLFVLVAISFTKIISLPLIADINSVTLSPDIPLKTATESSLFVETRLDKPISGGSKSTRPSQESEPVASNVESPDDLENGPGAFLASNADYVLTEGELYNSQAANYRVINDGFNYSFKTDPGSESAFPGGLIAAPYVPSKSFSYHEYEDTANPKQPIYSETDLKAREDLLKALAAIDQIDWEKFEKELGATQGDIQKLQAQLKKALQDIDWKKMEQDLQNRYKALEMEIKAKQAYLSQLNATKEMTIQEKTRKLAAEKQKLILLDRLEQRQSGEKATSEKGKARKIVVI